jgi:hypothetical protein
LNTQLKTLIFYYDEAVSVSICGWREGAPRATP